MLHQLKQPACFVPLNSNYICQICTTLSVRVQVLLTGKDNKPLPPEYPLEARTGNRQVIMQSTVVRTDY